MDEWISVKDRLPEPGRQVLMVTGWVGFLPALGRMNYATELGGEWDGVIIDPMRAMLDAPLYFRGTPTHWMPLPDTPQEGDDG